MYAVKRSRHEALVTDLFNDKDVKPPNRKTQAEKENEARDKQLAKAVRRGELIALMKEERERRHRRVQEVTIGPGHLHPSETSTDLEQYKLWTPGQAWPLSNDWVFKEKKAERNP